MLTTVKIQPGIQRDATPYDAPGTWWDSNLVRWHQGNLRPIGGNERNTSTALSGGVRKIFVWRDNVSTRHTLVGTDTKLYADVNGYVDVSPTALVGLSTIGPLGGYGTFNYGAEAYGTARSAQSPYYDTYAFWSMSNWGEDVILTNNADGRLFYYDTTTPSTKPVVVTATHGTTPIGISAVIVTAERHVMVLGAGGSNVVSWSSSEDYTDWDFASVTNTAGTITLQTRSPLVNAVNVREGVLLFTQAEVFLCRYVGLPYIYGFERLAATTLLNPLSVCTYNGQSAWQGRAGFWQYSGGYVQPLPCPIVNDIVTDSDPLWSGFRSHAGLNGVYPELWFWYASNGATECDKLVIWNYAENWWARSNLARSCIAPSEAYKLPYCGTSDGNIYEHESGYTDAGTSRVGTVWAESAMMAIGQADRTVEVNQAMPATGHGYDSLSLMFYSRMAQEGAERTFGPYLPRSTGYVDTRVSGRDVRCRITATKDEEWSVGVMRLDVTPGTGR
jgi:hypothetical protein